jgi:hypothetical protein
MVLTSKAPQFLPLSACRPVNALAGIPLGLLHPSGNLLCGRLELTRQLFGRASRSHQIDHLSPELRRISGSIAGHQTPQKSTSKVPTKPGQLQFTIAELVFMAPNWAYVRTNSAGVTRHASTGKTTAEANQELFIFKKSEDGEWRIARYSFSPTNPPGS